MARPQKEIKDRKTHRLPHVRCTEKEGKSIRANAEQLGMSVSDYVRYAALNFNKNAVSESANDNTQNSFNEGFIYELHRIGNNLNQLAKRYHIDRKEPPGLQRLFPVLEQLLTYIFKNIKIE